MRFTKRIKFTLWMGLIALNVILRLPTTPHEIGWDSFTIHILANSVSAFGEARWWANPLSIGGFYPLSYASAVPFILSGISQLTGIDMEWTIWLFCVIIGLFSAFTAYLLAGAIWNNDIFKFLVALGYSTSQGILSFTTWTVTTRGFFIVIAPLFIYTLLKCRTSAVRYGIFTFILFILLTVTHHLFYFTIPLLISYFVVVAFHKLGNHIKSIRIPENFINTALLASFFVMVSIPFFTREVWTTDPSLVRMGINSRYAAISPMLISYVRYIGPLIFFVIGGYFYILLKRGKRFEEWFLLVASISLAPFLYMPTYTTWFIVLFAFLLIGIGLSNVAVIRAYTQKKKYIVLLIVVLLLFSASFNGYYQFMHFLSEPKSYWCERYMEDATYVGGLWIRDNINKNLFWNNGYIGERAFAISEVPTLLSGAVGLTYGFANISELNITKNSPLSTEFYEDGPYVKTPGTPYTLGYINALGMSEIDSRTGKRLISKYSLSYVIEDEDIRDNVFIRSVHPVKNNVYNNGKIRIWCLD